MLIVTIPLDFLSGVFVLQQCNFPSSSNENEYNLKIEYVLTQAFSFSIVRQGEGELRYSRIYRNIQLFNCLEGTWICMDTNLNFFFRCSVVGEGLIFMWIYPNIQFFSWWGEREWELGYVWTQTYFFLQMFGRGSGDLDIRRYIQTFSFLIVWSSGNLVMSGHKRLVF